MPTIDKLDLGSVPGLEEKVQALALDLMPLKFCCACNRVHSRTEIFEMDFPEALDLSEILISGTCPDGFTKLFGDEDEDEGWACGETNCNPGKHEACAGCGTTSQVDNEDFTCEHPNGYCNSCGDKDACPNAECKCTDVCYYHGSMNCVGIADCEQ